VDAANRFELLRIFGDVRAVLLVAVVGAIVILYGIWSGRPQDMSCPPGYEARTVRVQETGRVPYWQLVTRCIPAD
jgi:hypothetical protein